MILVVVRRAGWSKSPFDSYTKEFADESAFVEWWAGLSDDSYTKKVSREYDRVKVYKGEPDGSLLMPFCPPVDLS